MATSTSVHVLACCLMANHYPNQCWHQWTLLAFSWGKFCRYCSTYYSLQMFKNYMFGNTAKSPRRTNDPVRIMVNWLCPNGSQLLTTCDQEFPVAIEATLWNVPSVYLHVWKHWIWANYHPNVTCHSLVIHNFVVQRSGLLWNCYMVVNKMFQHGIGIAGSKVIASQLEAMFALHSLRPWILTWKFLDNPDPRQYPV